MKILNYLIKRGAYNHYNWGFRSGSVDNEAEHMAALADPGGAVGTPSPPTGSNSFVFAYGFAKKHPRRRSVPPNR